MDEPEIVVEGEAPAADEGPERVTVVEVGDLPASADVATAVQRAPGVVVRRLGGLGDLATVSIRGAGARHTEVLLDGLPLNPEGGSAVDLSELPVRALERVEVWRGSAPALLGTTALGGAIALWTRSDEVTEGALSVGSWSTLRGTAVASQPFAGGSALVAVEGLATGGAFPWYDDGGTRGVLTDDATSIRENNDARRLTTTSRVTVGPLTVLHAGTWSDDGVPGYVFAPSTEVRYGLARHLLAARAEGRNLAVRGWALDRAESLSDPLGEVGVTGEELRTSIRSLGLDGQLRSPLASDLRLDLLAGARADALRAEDLASGLTEDPRGRSVLRASAGLPWDADDLDLRPSLGLLAVLSSDGQGADVTWLPIPRMALGWTRGPLEVSLDAGASARPPDLLELYGDRGAVVGNPELRPERGLSLDLGIGRSGLGEVVGFVSSLRDLVVYLPSAQGPVRAENVEGARIVGLEASATVGADPLSVLLVGSLLDAREVSDDPARHGRVLPRVPAGELLVVGQGRAGPLGLSVDASFTAGTWADAANIAREAPRLLLGATGRAALGRGWSLELDVRNLLDARTALVPRDPLVDDGIRVPQPLQDFGGYPLPGRTVLATLRFSPGLSDGHGVSRR